MGPRGRHSWALPRPRCWAGVRGWGPLGPQVALPWASTTSTPSCSWGTKPCCGPWMRRPVSRTPVRACSTCFFGMRMPRWWLGSVWLATGEWLARSPCPRGPCPSRMPLGPGTPSQGPQGPVVSVALAARTTAPPCSTSQSPTATPFRPRCRTWLAFPQRPRSCMGLWALAPCQPAPCWQGPTP